MPRIIIEKAKDGSIKSPMSLTDFFATLGAGSWVLTATRPAHQRSPQQNRLYHAWARALAEETGYDLEEMKNHLKEMFLAKESIREEGGTTVICRHITSSAELTRAQFTEFLNKVHRWAETEFPDINLPTPDDTSEAAANFIEAYTY